MDMVRPLLRVLALCALFWTPACATSGGTPQDISSRIQKETGHPTRDGAADPAVPDGVVLEDGLTEQEAVALALWNNSGFQESLADLGVARADLLQAGLLRNPVLSLLFPWGPKQLEATARWPIDALWQRPHRVAAARLTTEAVGERLVATGLRPRDRTSDGGRDSRWACDVNAAESAIAARVVRAVRTTRQPCFAGAAALNCSGRSSTPINDP